MDKKQIQWHPAFIAAMDLELTKNRNGLIFEKEYNLNVKPLEIDLMILKKFPRQPVENEIGKIFRKHNILEYKSPMSKLNVDTYFKTLGYGCLYKSYGKTVDAVKKEEITITMIRYARPNGLFHYFKNNGYLITTPYAGIYYISGDVIFPTQIIVTKELDHGQHTWLRALSNELEKRDLLTLMAHFQQLSEKQETESAEAVLKVAFEANIQIMKQIIGDERMSEELLEIIKPIVEPRILILQQEARNQGFQQGIEQGIEQGIQGAVDLLRDMGCNDRDIKTAIIAKYKLSTQDAEKFFKKA